MRCFVVTFALLCICSAVVSAVEPGAHHTFRYLTTSGYPRTLKTMTFSPDGNQLAVVVGGTVDFIDTRLGQVTGQYKASPFMLRYTRDGGRLYMIESSRDVLLDTLVGSQIETRYQIKPGFVGFKLEKESGKLLIKKIFPGGPVSDVPGIGINDELVAVAQGRNGSMRELVGREVQEAIKLLKGPAGTYLQLQILPRGKFGKDSLTTHVIRRAPGEIVGDSVRFLELAPVTAGDTLAWCVVDGRFEFRDTQTGTPIAQLNTIDVSNRGLGVISPDQSKFAFVARTKSGNPRLAVEVFEIATQERLAYMPLPKSSSYDIDFAADNNRVLVATWDSVEVANTAQGRFDSRLTLGWNPLPQPKENKRSYGSVANIVTSVADSIADGSNYGKDGLRSQYNLVSKLAVSSKNIVATADDSGRVKLWDFSGELLRELPQSPADDPKAMEFSADGKWLAYHIEGVLHLVDVADIEPLPKSALEVPSGSKSAKSTPTSSPSIPGLAGPSDSSTVAVTAGAKVEVLSRGHWYPATIVSGGKPGRWHIHYDDSPDDWDEVVAEGRIRVRAAQLAEGQESRAEGGGRK